MRSTPVVACRALIMLATLVAVPSVALFWESLPRKVDKALVVLKERLGFPLVEPKRWVDRNSQQPAPELAEAPKFQPVPNSPFSGPEPAAALRDTTDRQPQYHKASPASFEAPLPVSPAPPSPPSTEQFARPSDDPFAAVQKRLRDLGATYYLLESWGEGRHFRFHCRMAMAGSATYSRQFEATAAEPMAAMLAVLRQAEDWRAGRQP